VTVGDWADALTERIFDAIASASDDASAVANVASELRRSIGSLDATPPERGGCPNVENGRRCSLVDVKHTEPCVFSHEQWIARRDRIRSKQNEERRAPVQADDTPRKLRTGAPGEVPGTVAWSEHLEAWPDYARRYGGDQSAERIAERGGFSYWELCKHLGRAPTTWRPR